MSQIPNEGEHDDAIRYPEQYPLFTLQRHTQPPHNPQPLSQSGDTSIKTVSTSRPLLVVSPTLPLPRLNSLEHESTNTRYSAAPNPPETLVSDGDLPQLSHPGSFIPSRPSSTPPAVIHNALAHTPWHNSPAPLQGFYPADIPANTNPSGYVYSSVCDTSRPSSTSQFDVYSQQTVASQAPPALGLTSPVEPSYSSPYPAPARTIHARVKTLMGRTYADSTQHIRHQSTSHPHQHHMNAAYLQPTVGNYPLSRNFPVDYNSEMHFSNDPLHWRDVVVKHPQTAPSTDYSIHMHVDRLQHPFFSTAPPSFADSTTSASTISTNNDFVDNNFTVNITTNTVTNTTTGDIMHTVANTGKIGSEGGGSRTMGATDRAADRDTGRDAGTDVYVTVTGGANVTEVGSGGVKANIRGNNDGFAGDAIVDCTEQSLGQSAGSIGAGTTAAVAAEMAVDRLEAGGVARTTAGRMGVMVRVVSEADSGIAEGVGRVDRVDVNREMADCVRSGELYSLKLGDDNDGEDSADNFDGDVGDRQYRSARRPHPRHASSRVSVLSMLASREQEQEQEDEDDEEDHDDRDQQGRRDIDGPESYPLISPREKTGKNRNNTGNFGTNDFSGTSFSQVETMDAEEHMYAIYTGNGSVNSSDMPVPVGESGQTATIRASVSGHATPITCTITRSTGNIQDSEKQGLLGNLESEDSEDSEYQGLTESEIRVDVFRDVDVDGNRTDDDNGLSQSSSLPTRLTTSDGNHDNNDNNHRTDISASIDHASSSSSFPTSSIPSDSSHGFTFACFPSFPALPSSISCPSAVSIGQFLLSLTSGIFMGIFASFFTFYFIQSTRVQPTVKLGMIIGVILRIFMRAALIEKGGVHPYQLHPDGPAGDSADSGGAGESGKPRGLDDLANGAAIIEGSKEITNGNFPANPDAGKPGSGGGKKRSNSPFERLLSQKSERRLQFPRNNMARFGMKVPFL